MDNNQNVQNQQNQYDYQQQYQQNPNYYAPQSQYVNTEPMTIGNWLVMFLVFLIPIVNIVMLFVWGFGEGNINRKNYCKAKLIWAAILSGIYILIFIAFGSVISSIINSYGYY